MTCSSALGACVSWSALHVFIPWLPRASWVRAELLG